MCSLPTPSGAGQSNSALAALAAPADVLRERKAILKKNSRKGRFLVAANSPWGWIFIKNLFIEAIYRPTEQFIV